MPNKLHEKVLDCLLEYRKDHPEFYFWLRQRDRKNRLSQGLWFQGTENYAFVGLYNRGGGSNMTRSVGLIFKFADDGSLTLDMEIVWNGETDQRIINFYQHAINELGGFQKQTKTKYGKMLAERNGESAVVDFLNSEKPKLDQLLYRDELADTMFIKQEAFDQQLKHISGLRTAYQNGAGKENHTRNYKMKTPLNQILYGPPGTGKTYHTINKALSIIESKSEVALENEQRDELLKRFNDYVDSGQIVFTTFHQSMTYEDFIEGIKPVPPIEGDTFVKYEVRRGIFREICEAASQSKGSSNFDEAYLKFIDDISQDDDFELQTPKQKKPFRVRINSNKTVVAIPQTEKGTEMGITKEMFREYVLNDVIKDWKPYTTALGDYFKKNYDVKVEQLDNRHKNYVLIVDEINRGNVSQIFGELITLLEESKREQGEEPLTVTLPYSQKRFSVPSNLYIIGTMNTADRSVEALDAALRRRFSFTEMLPDASLIAKKGKLKDGILDEDPNYKINLVRLLETINLRIEKLVDRDHQIGHSYFLSVEDWETLRQAFYKCLIPLLQEYFFGDYGKIALVLGKGFVEPKEDPKSGTSFFADVPEGYEDLAERKVYKIKVYNANEIDGFKEAVQKIKIIAGANE